MRTSRLRARDIVRVLSVGYGGAFLPGDRDDLAVVCPADHLTRPHIAIVVDLGDALEIAIVVSPVRTALIVEADDLAHDLADGAVLVVLADVGDTGRDVGVLRQQVDRRLFLITGIVWSEVGLLRVGVRLSGVVDAVRSAVRPRHS